MERLDRRPLVDSSMNRMNAHELTGSPRPRILLVEDNEAAGQGLARLLEASGYEVTSVITGERALRSLAEAPPDFLLTDLQLPDIDGRELALHARQLSPPPHIVLITGWDVEDDPTAFASWGVDRLLIKPLDVTSLLATLDGFAGREKAETTQIP